MNIIQFQNLKKCLEWAKDQGCTLADPAIAEWNQEYAKEYGKIEFKKHAWSGGCYHIIEEA